MAPRHNEPLRGGAEAILGNSSATPSDTSPMTWWTFDDKSGVLELGSPSVELHWHLIGGRTLAWWTDELGRRLCQARVGLA